MALAGGIGAFVASTMAMSAFAQSTPSPDNYIAIVPDALPFYASKLDKASSLTDGRLLSLVGFRNYSPSLYTLSANVGNEVLPLSTPGTSSSTRGEATAISGNLLAGYQVQSGAYKAQAWEKTANGIIRTDLNTVVAPLIGMNPASVSSFAHGVNGSLVAGYAGFSYYPKAVAWEKTASGFAAVNLHQTAGLPSTSLSEAKAVFGNRVVGYGGREALQWDRNPSTGAYTVTTLASQNLLGANSEAEATGTDGIYTAGSGSGTNTGVKTNINGRDFYHSHALYWSGGSSLDFHQATRLNDYLGAGAESWATDIAGGVMVGSGHGANMGRVYYSNGSSEYAPHALRWANKLSVGSTVLDLQQFLPVVPTSQTTRPFTNATAITNDGIILGTASNFPQFGPVSPNQPTIRNVIWQPLDLLYFSWVRIPQGTTGYLTKSFNQGKGAVYVLGKLDLNKGASAATYTLTNGGLGGNGWIDGSVVHNGGVVTPDYNPNGAFTISTYIQRGGSLSIHVYYQTFNQRMLRLTANRLATGYASLNGRLSMTVPYATPRGSRFTVLTAARIDGAFTSVTPGWQVSYYRTLGNSSVVATYVGQ
ncbi:MAG: hypothetical protein H8F28_24265 [Fibrella sp.]|nr:hypothetical protein [Armatimonadota bacterium]